MRTRPPDPTLPGLSTMLAASGPQECPFCGDPPAGRSRFCGGPECQTAYMRCWRRDARRGLYRKKRPQ